MNNRVTQTLPPLVIGITLGIIIGGWLLTAYITLPWFIGSMALLCMLIAWWQTPCIQAVLYDTQTDQHSEQKKKQRFPCFKRWLLRLLGYGVLLVLLVVAEAVWWVKQPVVMNISYYYLDKKDKDKKKEKQQTLPLHYALNKPLWQLGIVPKPRFVEVPKGEFEMGSNKYQREKPVHTVTIKYPFIMSRHEITFAQYDYYVWSMQQYRQQHLKQLIPKNTKMTFPLINYPDDEGWGRDSRPVINISWQDAQGYVNWLSKERKQSCRLPSEAEWEYAARAGTTTDYFWGENASHEYANYGKEECCGGLVKGRDQWLNTAPVGSFPANAFGLQDMNGNVWEWVQDHYQINYQDAPTDGSVWEKPARGGRVLRGGSWYYYSDYMRASNRYFSTADYRYDGSGFRVVCALPFSAR